VPDLDQKLDPPEIEPDTPPRRRIALAAAIIALVGSLAGAASAIADGNADRLRREAQRQSVSALAARAAALADLYDVRSRNAVHGGLAARRTLALIHVEVFGSQSIDGETAAWTKAADDLEAISPQGALATLPGFFDYTGERLGAADLLSLRADASRETSSSWAHKADLYFMAVTMLAVVLALLGLSATLGDRLGRWFFVAAGTLVIASAVAAGSAKLAGITRTPEAAVRAVADGNARLYARDWTGAVGRYDAALRERADYAPALRQRASATIAAGSRGVDAFVIPDSTQSAYEHAARDLDRVLDQGIRDPLTLTNQAASLFHLRQYRRSEALSREALEKQTLPLPLANLGLVIAAQGREQEAERTYRRFVELVESESKARNRDPLERDALYSSSLTTLDKLARLEPARAGLAGQLQGLVLSAWASQGAPGATRPTTAKGTLTLRANQTSVAADLRYTGVAPRAPAAFAVYYRLQGGADWILHPSLSFVGPWQLAPDGTANYRRVDTSCLPEGDLRVDVFVSGWRIATSTVTRGGAPPGYQAFADSRTRLSGCRPSDWTADEEAPGLVSYHTADGGSFAVRSAPLGGRDGGGAVTVALDRASGRLGIPAGLPSSTKVVAGINGLGRGAGVKQAWAAVHGNSVFVITSTAGASDLTAPTWIWNSLVLP
jgi:tetratricopeptide (TPR) repeat protein